jgi:type IX secretion system PorP/SprF family membrane protein
MKSQYKKYIATAFVLGFIGCVSTVKAQLNPLSSQYFGNQYLFNPAMAGMTEGWNFNLDYRKQSMGVNGSPSTQSGTVEYLMNKVGLGLNVYNDQSGLLRTTRAVVTYAYHLPLGGDNQKLNFGLSGGLLNQRIQTSDLIGDAGDATVADFNNKQNYFDGDLGVSYTSNKWTVQAVVPNMHMLFSDNSTVNKSLFSAAASYKFGEAKDIVLEPKAVFRAVKGASSIVDAGVNVAFNEGLFSLQGLYHSSKNATFGVGINKASYAILAFYTTNTASLNYNANGDFELGVRFNLSKK